MEERKITANDIMIGNWFIGYDGKPFKWELHEFEAISHHISIDEIIKEPIILTEHYLDLLGFGMRFATDPQQPNALRIRYLDDFKLLRFEDNNSIFYSSGNGFHTDVLYIHELQNLYKVLTKNELDINLWKI